MEKLLNKVLKDSEAKAQSIIEEAKKKLQADWIKEQSQIKQVYQDKLAKEKEKIQRQTELEVTQVKLQNQQAILAEKNRFLDEIFQILEKKFEDFVASNFASLLNNVLQNLIAGDYTVRIPNQFDFSWPETESKKVRVIRDPVLQNGFILESKNWILRFDWANIKQALFSELVAEINQSLFAK